MFLPLIMKIITTGSVNTFSKNLSHVLIVPVYILKMFPSLCTDSTILPDSCSSSFRRRPTCSEWTTSQNTQISARSLWMLALHGGSQELRTDRVRDRHTCREEGGRGNRRS